MIYKRKTTPLLSLFRLAVYHSSQGNLSAPGVLTHSLDLPCYAWLVKKGKKMPLLRLSFVRTNVDIYARRLCQAIG
ncbi:hypothetical protein ES705_22756 [subsurface metagenome]